MPASKDANAARATLAGFLAWLIPGLGHYWLGQRALGVVFFIAISAPYWTGMALGGLLDSASLRTNAWLVAAAMGVGGYTPPCVLASSAIESRALRDAGLNRAPNPMSASAAERDQHRRYLSVRAPYMSFFPGSDVAQIYVAAAGLLNLLAILDAIARALTGGEPTYRREAAAAQAAREGLA
jgi:hypothetical protein